ncbi:MAG: RAD55 family ATPase [Nitrososphaeraceae archaeon]|jgi:KaiC/GvpD/RAD55 family RecA-like ATPase
MTKNYDISFKIPDDLLQFLNNETYSLLIKGEPGAGKTALCLTILKALNIKNNFFYISTRVSPNKLFYYFKWINKYLKIKYTNNHNKSSKHLNSLEPFFEDARLDEPESLFERITNQLMDVRSPLIIVDSWDGIASFMDRESRLNNERVLQTWLERAGGRLILVNEGNELTTLDYLVDGIVILKKNQFNHINVREMNLTKLGGIDIKKNSFVYTLNNGIFKTYEPIFHYDDILNQILNLPTNKLFIQNKIIKIDSGHLSLNTDLNGGFTKKSIVLLEYDPNLEMRYIILFLFNFITNCISNSHMLLLDTKIAKDIPFLLNLIRFNAVDSNDYDKFVKLIDLNLETNIENLNDNLTTDLLINPISTEIKNIKTNSMIFSILNFDRYKNIDVYKLINALKEKLDLSFLLLQTGIRSELSPGLFDYKLTIKNFNDVICIHLTYPYLRLYGLEVVNIEKSNFSIRLDPLI